MEDMQRQKVTAVIVVTGALLLGQASCGGSAPPPGERLRLRGAKGAQCAYDRECQSGKCLGQRCTEKIDQVGLGGECTGDDYCMQGFRCDLAAKKCAPKLECDAFSGKLRQCIVEVYLAFRPKQAPKLRRMRARAKRSFLNKIYGILYQGLCSLTRGGAGYKRSLALQQALGQTRCDKFAAHYYQGTRKGG
jgi:hypothetical protein